MARLALSLLGPFEAKLNESPVTGFDSSRVRALLAYLAIEADRPHSREALAALLWPDQADRVARTNLRNALANLRRAIHDHQATPPYLLVTRETIQFNRACDHWIDATAFDGLARTDGADGNGKDGWEQAVTLYRGPFLEGLSVGDSPALEDWTLVVRERLQRQVLGALQRLTAHYERCGAYGRAGEAAWRHVALAPWQEQAHQDLMRLLALSGQRGAALAQYAACRRALREELDVEPGVETRQLYERIRDGELAPRQESEDSDTVRQPFHEPPPAPHDLADRVRFPSQQEQPQGPMPLEGERRIVTVILADVKGSTALSEQVDVERWVEIMDRVFQILGQEIYAYGGEIDQYRGDGLVAFFGLPPTHEDDPERAVLAALAMQEALARYAAELAQREGIALSLRVGINTGEVIAATVGSRRRREETAMGRAIAIADRTQALAEPGTVLVTAATYHLVAPLFEWQAMGETEAKGLSLPIATYRPLAHRAAPGKGRGVAGLSSPLVGRDKEFRALQEAIEKLRAGVGGLVTVVGEAGIGKSRLVAEVRHSVLNAAEMGAGKDDNTAARADLQWVEGRCLSYTTGVAYQVWLDYLRGLLRVAPDAAQDTVRDVLKRRVQALCPDCFDQVYPYLCKLMSLPLEDAYGTIRDLQGESLKAETSCAIGTLIASAARQRPQVVVCEDLHWADPTSMELLEGLLALIDRVPVLFLCVFRPETAHGCWRIKEAGARHYRHRHTDLWLNPLSTAESAVLVGNLLRVEDLPEELRSRMLGASEGNPLYVEEIIRSLIDDGAIHQDEATGRWQAAQKVEHITLPDTLHGLLAARIDRLPKETRRILRLASVIGRVFSGRVLAEIARASAPSTHVPGEADERQGTPGGRAPEAHLVTHLVALEREQLIRERARVPEREYIFKHHLTQVAAYSGLLKKERRLYHRQTAEALERLFPDRAEEQLGLLAYHWTCASEPVKAVEYLLRAGEQARVAYANQEAIDYYTRSLALLDESEASTQQTGPDGAEPQDRSRQRKRLTALRGLGKVYLGVGKVAEAEAALREAVALAKETGVSIHELVRLTYWLGDAVYWLDQIDEMLRIGEEGLALLGDDVESVEAALMNGHIAIAYMNKGDARGFEFAYRTAQFIQRLPYVEELRPAYGHIQAAYRHDKNTKEAIRWGHILRERARAKGDLRGQATALEYLGQTLTRMGDWHAGLARTQEALDLYARIGDVKHEGWALRQMAFAYLRLGDTQQAEGHWKRYLQVAQTTGLQRELAIAYEIGGLISLCRRRWEEAEMLLRKALSLCQELGAWQGQAWIHHVLGRIRLAHNDALATEQFMRSLELTSHEDLEHGQFGFALMLYGLESALQDGQAFRAFCHRIRQEHAQIGELPFAQWYLEPAEVGTTRRPPLLCDEFTTLSPEWTWHDPFADCSYTVGSGIEIRAANGRELFGINQSAPRLLRAVAGNLTVQTTCMPAPDRKPTVGGLLLWKDKRNYLYLVRGMLGAQDVLFGGNLEDADTILGRGRLPVDAKDWSGRVFLRLERAEGQVRALCSTDGERWFTAGQAAFPAVDPVQVGLYVSDTIHPAMYPGTTAEGSAVHLNSFQLWN